MNNRFVIRVSHDRLVLFVVSVLAVINYLPLLYVAPYLSTISEKAPAVRIINDDEARIV